jgi:hypothetical protein
MIVGSFGLLCEVPGLNSKMTLLNLIDCVFGTDLHVCQGALLLEQEAEHQGTVVALAGFSKVYRLHWEWEFQYAQYSSSE